MANNVHQLKEKLAKIDTETGTHKGSSGSVHYNKYTHTHTHTHTHPPITPPLRHTYLIYLAYITIKME